ncbi:hypothetical protein Tco_0096149, partial [Tanacetum coccineum]
MHGSYHACHVLLQNESYMHDKYGATRMTYGGPSLSNDGEKRKDGGRRSNLVATSPKADTHLALALNENP